MAMLMFGWFKKHYKSYRIGSSSPLLLRFDESGFTMFLYMSYSHGNTMLMFGWFKKP